MSRTYYEWRDAKNAWLAAQNKRVSNLPYPDRESIVYERPSTNDFWERRRQYAESLIPQTTLSYTAQDTFSFIRSVAQAEETKELNFLKEFFPKGEGYANMTLTDQFNILFQTRERYERLLERIHNARQYAKNGWKGMAPNMDTLYASYLNTRLTKVIETFRASFTATADLKMLEQKFKQLVDNAIVEATNDIAAVTTEDDVYGSGKDWAEIASMINNDPYLRDNFITNMRNAIGNDNINAVLKAMYEQKSTKGKKQKTSTILREKLKLSSRTASIGGNVIENTSAALAKYLSQIRGSNGSISYSMSGGAISGEMVRTDTAFIFSAEATVNTQNVLEELNKQLSGNTGSLTNAYNAIEKFYKDQKEQLDKLYTVFINAKNYQLGGSHGTYVQHESGSLTELDDFLSRANIQVGAIDDFLYAAYNTAAGAIYANSKDTIYEGAINALKAAAVKFMFDDWQTLGANNSNGIHMFLLSGKYVPSSVIFNAMADAGNSMVSGRANIIVPEINDPGPQGWSGSNDAEVKENIMEHWNDEYNRISANARWTADFVLNVKQAIG